MQNSASVCSETVSEMLLIVVGVVSLWWVCSGDDVLFFIYDVHTTCSPILRGKTNWNVHVFISMIVWLVGLNIKIPIPPKKLRAHPIFQYSLKPSKQGDFVFVVDHLPVARARTPQESDQHSSQPKHVNHFDHQNKSIPKCLIRLGSQPHYFLAC